MNEAYIKTILDSLQFILTEKPINTFSKYSYDIYIVQSLFDHLDMRYNYSKQSILKLLYNFYEIRLNKIKKTKHYSDIYDTNYDDNNLRIISHFINTLKDYQVV